MLDYLQWMLSSFTIQNAITSENIISATDYLAKHNNASFAQIVRDL